MLINTIGDPLKATQDALPKNWDYIEADSLDWGIMRSKEYFPRNLWVVTPGKLYRSAIPWTHQLWELRTAYDIRNIVSLIGWSWLDEDELDRYWIQHFQYNVLQRRALTKEIVGEIVDKIQSLEGPTLVHCLKWAVRTGQVVAWYRLWVEHLARPLVHLEALWYWLINISAHREIANY